MAAKKQKQLLQLPGETDWEYWEQSGPGSWQVVEDFETSKRYANTPVLHAFEARSVYAVPLQVSANDPKVVRQIVGMQLENRRLQPETVFAGNHISYWTVAEKDSQSQILATVLPDEIASYNPGKNIASFDISARMYELPADRIVLWKELGDWVVAFTRGTELAFFETLSADELDDDGVLEVLTIRGSLTAQRFLGSITGVEVRHSEFPQETKALLERMLSLPVTVVPRSSPRLSTPLETDLVPEAVAQERISQKRQKLIAQCLFLGVVVYLCAIGVFIMFMLKQEQENKILADWNEANQEAADRIRHTQEQWYAMEPATDVDRYPTELFMRIVSLLPNEGVRLTGFGYNSGDTTQVSINGEASDKRTAIQWQGQVKKSEDAGGLFENYQWEVPTPTSLPDNRAKFLGQAIYTGTSITPEEMGISTEEEAN